MRGATTCLLWLKRDDDTAEALIYGTQAGYLICWIDELDKETVDKSSLNRGELKALTTTQGARVFREVWCRQLVDAAEITGLAFDAMTNRLSVCHRGGLLQMYALAGTTIQREVYSWTIPNCVPRAIEFGAMFGNERELMIFGQHCGLV
uniref:Uncharacterized protein n=1 Tax=Mycena chlorophos TaxID=658473 RepID=A0ABQ0KWA4_MYCCL|nr:predicted protein [Mycena chlorophos]